MAEVPNLTNPTDVRLLCASIAEASAAGTTALLDFSELDRDGTENRRLDGTAVALLTNVLLGLHGDADITVRPPRSTSMLRQLRRGGFFFALAQRAGRTRWTSPDDESLVSGWGGTWRPAKGDRLFDDGSADRVEERLYLYANTHRLGQGFFRQYQPGAAMPWLADLVPMPHDRSLRAARQSFVASAVEAVVEVLENLATHAFKPRGAIDDDWLRPHGRRAKSMVACSLTKGGGADSWDRLHVLAIDNGYGIGRTLRWQHPQATHSTADLLDAVLKRKFLERDIPGHSGRGLWYLHGLARIAGGSVALVTEDDETMAREGVRLGFSTPPAEAGPTAWDPPVEVAVPVRGTILLLDLAVPSAVHGDATPMAADYRTLRSEPATTS